MRPLRFAKRQWSWRRGDSGPRLLPEYRFHGTDVFLLRLLRITGLAPINIRRLQTGCAVSMSYNQMLYSYVKYTIIGIIIVAGFLVDLFDESNAPERTTISVVMWSINVLLALCSTGFGALRSTTRTTRLLHFLSQAKKINKQFEGTASAASTGRLYFQLLFCLFVYFSASTLKIFRLILYSKSAVLVCTYNLLCFYVNSFVAVLMEMQIMHTVQHMKKTVQCINNRMKAFLRDLKANKNAAYDTESLRELRHLTKKYIEVRDLTHQLSDSEGTLLLCLLLEIAFHINTCSYHIYLSCLLNVPSIFYKIGKIFERFIMCLHYWAIFALLVEPCHETRKELDETRVLVSKLLCFAPSALSPLSRLLQRFARQLQVTTRVFTPLGVFTFSRSLYTAVIGCVTTYFSIAMKYRMKEWSL